jgi:hypothetical protein
MINTQEGFIWNYDYSFGVDGQDVDMIELLPSPRAISYVALWVHMRSLDSWRFFEIFASLKQAKKFIKHINNKILGEAEVS